MRSSWKSPLLVEIPNGAGTLENSLVIIYKKFYNIIDTFPIQPSNPTSRYLPMKNYDHTYVFFTVVLFIVAQNWN